MSTRQPPVIERYGDTWIQHPDGLYDGLQYPSDDDDQLILLARFGRLGHRSVRRGDDRYSLRYPEAHEEDDA